MAVQLGKITREHDLRTVWSNEAQAFTPWLAEHLDVLGDALGITIELEERESSVGAFSLDILARDQDSGKDAKYIVWSVKDAREEHRAAIEWLIKPLTIRLDFSIRFFVVSFCLKTQTNQPAESLMGNSAGWFLFLFGTN